MWGLAQFNGKHENLIVYPCPPGYCRCFHDRSSLGDEICSFAYINGDPDRQCTCKRQGKHYMRYEICNCIHSYLLFVGYLCGDCKNGEGVSALLNRCVNCSDAYGILIAVLSKNSSQHAIVYLFTCIIVPLQSFWMRHLSQQ